MKKLFLLLLFAFGCIATDGATFITLTISVTNGVTGTTNYDSLEINGDTRAFTNNTASAPSTLIQCTNGYLLDATNIYQHYALYPIGAGATRLFVAMSSPSNITFRAQADQVITFTNYSTNATPVWGTGTLATNVGGAEVVVRVPIDSHVTTVRTSILSDLVLSSHYSTNALLAGTTIVSNLLQRSGDQTATGAKVFNGSISGTVGTLTNGSLQGGILSNSVAIGGNVYRLTNGVFWTPVATGITTTNLTNYGKALSSPGTGDNSEQFGAGADATAAYATALGADAQALAYSSVAIGAVSSVPEDGGYAIAIGEAASAELTNAIAIGAQSIASGSNSIAIGTAATAAGMYAVAIGNDSSASDDYSFVIGTDTNVVTIPGVLQVGVNLTNTAFKGTNHIAGDLGFAMTTIATIANGPNFIDPGTASTYVYLSDNPTAAWSLDAIDDGRPGRVLVVENNTGQDMTIAHESGATAGAAADRIVTPTGADVSMAGRGTTLFIYNGTSSRWVLIHPSGTEVVMPYSTFLSTTNIPFGDTTNVSALTFDTSSIGTGMAQEGWSKMWASNAATYFISFSAVVTKSDAGNDWCDLWLAKNGTDVANSRTRITMTAANEIRVMTVTFIETTTAAAYFEIRGATDDDDLSLLAAPAVVDITPSPAMPAIIVTINKISD